ncbi:ribonuclease R [Marinomonas agarivorans]|nr:ribonuclease R [Marinomonas agarivorans]
MTKKSKAHTSDPFQAREASKYENPIPSREYILEFLTEAGRAYQHLELCTRFGLTGEDEIEALRRRLIAMSRDHQLNSVNDQYTPLAQTDFITGIIQGSKDGHGFLLQKEADDVFISARQMQRVMDGDKVTARLSGRTVRGRMDGVIVDVLERKHTRLVGRYYRESQSEFVTPENPRINQDILINKASGLTPEHGQYVVVEILSYPDKDQATTGIVTQILGDFMAPGLEIDVALHRFDVPHEWPEAVAQQIKHIDKEVSEEDKLHRVDLRQQPFVTIDGEDARDFDDAVMCEKTASGWKLFVAIADVSHYVKKGTALDEEAIIRGNSVYFPGRVIPMLPEVLSNGLCSLNPDVDRLAMVAEISLTTKGKMRGYKFYEGVIRSHARLTYTKVAQMIADVSDDETSLQTSSLRERYANIISHIDDLAELYTVLRDARATRGALEFDTVETRMVFDQFSKIDQIVPVERNDAHKMIEECMLCANVAAAEFLLKANLPALFRVHEGPKEDKLLALRTYLSILGLSLEGGLTPGPDDYAKLAEQIRERPDARNIQTMILRSMSQAVYTPDNIGHFGLNYEAYTHFTSPIRRYPDLLVHRAIRYLIRGEGRPRMAQAYRVPGSPTLKARKIYGYDDADMDGLGDSCSATERRADEATRDVEAWLKCQYVEQHIGEEFEGRVSAVTPFGLFVELQGLYVDGLVHISSLGNDYFHHDPERQVIIGERTSKTYRLGDTLKVAVSQVNLEQRKIDLMLLASAPKSRRVQQKNRLSELEMQLAQLPTLELEGKGLGGTELGGRELGGRAPASVKKTPKTKQALNVSAKKQDSGKGKTQRKRRTTKTSKVSASSKANGASKTTEVPKQGSEKKRSEKKRSEKKDSTQKSTEKKRTVRKSVAKTKEPPKSAMKAKRVKRKGKKSNAKARAPE